MTTEQKSAPKRKRLLITAALIFIVIGVCYAIWWAVVASHYETTDDAYVHGNLVQVTSQIAGTVIGIEADNTELVKQGQTLVKLDPNDTRVALRQAEAAQAQALRHTLHILVKNDELKSYKPMPRAKIDTGRATLAPANKK